MGSTKRRRARLAAPAAALVAHATVLAGGFVWLDHAHLEAGLAVAPPRGWADLFTHGFAGTGFYRPLVSLSLSIDALVGAAWFFHAMSLVWHAAAAAAVTHVASLLGGTRRAATYAGVLFAVHPVASLVAGAIAFRSEAMLAVGLLALVAGHVQRRPAMAAVGLAFAALTKETALVVGPLLVLGLEIGALRETDRPRRPVLMAEGAALGAALALRGWFAPPWRAEHVDLSWSEAIGTRLASLARAATSLGAPIERSVCDAFAVAGVTDPRAIAGAAVAAGLGWLAWRRRGPALLLAASMLPLLQIVPIMRWWSVHYLYLPLAFASMLAAEVVARAKHPRALTAGYGAALLLAAISLLDGRRYRDDEVLWGPEVDRNPACREGQFYLAESARARGAMEEAASRYEAALAPRPGILAYVDRAAALQNLGETRRAGRDLGGARRAYEDALATTTDPEARRKLVHNLAALALETGDPAECWRLLAPEVARDDALSETLYVAAKARHALGDEVETRALIERLRRRGWTGSPPSAYDPRP